MPMTEDSDYEKAVQLIKNKYNLDYCLITRGSEGMTYNIGIDIFHKRVEKKEVFDVSGAGDTVIACLAASYAAGLELNDCFELSSVFSSEVVEYTGTVPFSIEMLKDKYE